MELIENKLNCQNIAKGTFQGVDPYAGRGRRSISGYKGKKNR
jgi:hypothetical protein